MNVPKMRIFASIKNILSGVAVALAIVAGSGSALGVTIQPYVQVTANVSSLNMGTISQQGTYDVPTTLTVKVAGNTAHGGLTISATPLESTTISGTFITKAQLFVKAPLMNNYVSLANPVNATGPMPPGIFNIPLLFRIVYQMEVPAGTYTGTITLTAAPPP